MFAEDNGHMKPAIKIIEMARNPAPLTRTGLSASFEAPFDTVSSHLMRL